MPNKLTDAEIIKALERLIELTSKDMLISNKGVTYGNVLDLINRQEKKIAELFGISEQLEKCKDTLICEKFKLLEKIEQLENGCKNVEQENKSLKAEVERLKIKNAVIMKQSLAENKTTATAIMAETKQHIMTAEKIKRLEEDNERLKNHIQEGIDLAKQIPEMLALAKAEAYKEFDELLKDECLSYPLKEDDITMLVDVKSYNNLLNELVGE